MIRLVFLLRRRPGLSFAEFSDRWRLDHGPIVAAQPDPRWASLRYTQTHRLDDPMNEALARARGGMEPPYDGVAELWWESEDALAAARRHGRPGAVPAPRCSPTRPSSSTSPRSPLWLAHEYPQVNPAPETIARPPEEPRSSSCTSRCAIPTACRSTRRSATGGPARPADPLDGAGASGCCATSRCTASSRPFEAALRASRGHRRRGLHGPRRGVVRPQPSAPAPEAAEAGRRAIEDERRFIDFARSAIWIGKEHVFVDRI